MNAAPNAAANAEEALLAGRGAVWIPRDVVRVAGPDARTFLQGQLSQDVAALADGTSALTLVLQPTGKVDVLARVTHTGPDSFLLDTQGGFGEALVARLRRFKLRVKADVEQLAGWRCLRVLGSVDRLDEQAGTVDVPTGWPALDGVDRLGPEPAIPDGFVLCPLEALEPVRILAGVPRMGVEITERTIPAEAGIVDLTVSFTKGCFTGQELVARIDSRGGHVPRHLRRLIGTSPSEEPVAVPPPGSVVEVGGHAAGEVTSTAWSATRHAPVALGYLQRDAAEPGAAVVRWDGGEVAMTVADLRP